MVADGVHHGGPSPAHLLQILFPKVLKIGNWNRKIMNHFVNHGGDPGFSRVTCCAVECVACMSIFCSLCGERRNCTPLLGFPKMVTA